MRPDSRPDHPGDRVRYQHIVDAAEKAVALVVGKSPEVLHTDYTLALALTRLVEIIGEAAWQISPAGRARPSLPWAPWAQIIGMRHRIVHAYFDINYAILWSTVQQSLPELLTQVRPVLATCGPSPRDRTEPHYAGAFSGSKSRWDVGYATIMSASTSLML
jgi:uncharacterized protein with HEPN domain